MTVSRTASLKNDFPDPISFDSAKRNGVGPPKKSASLVLGCVPLNDRRTMSGHRKHPLPLPLLSTMFQYLHPNRPRLAHLAFAAGASRGPGTVLRLPAQRQRKAALCVSAHPTPERDGCTIGMLSRKKWGSLGGKGPMEPGRPSGRRSIRARPPERVFGDFLREQKVTPRRVGTLHNLQGPRPWPGHPLRQGGGESGGAAKRNGVGKIRPQRRQPLDSCLKDAVLGFLVLSARAKSRSPPGETWRDARAAPLRQKSPRRPSPAGAFPHTGSTRP